VLIDFGAYTFFKVRNNLEQEQKDMKNNESSFKTADGLNIFTRSWKSDGESRAVVVIVPGFNSHSGYYGWVAEQLTGDGLAVYSLDLRGRGRSDGERFFVDKFSDYVSDAGQMIDIARRENPDVPVFLLGHSAGGIVAVTYALDNQDKLAGLICESFAYELPAPDFALAVFKGLDHIFPHAHVLPLKNKDFSRDPEAVEKMNNDPLIAHETQPTRTLAEMVRTDERLKKDFPTLNVPILILHGTNDKATKPAGSQYFYDNAGSTDKTLKLYQGGYHDLLNDTDKATVIADIRAWIAHRVPVIASAATEAL
jgi:alpha-beta hydrolase superfamily lysophospholipase